MAINYEYYTGYTTSAQFRAPKTTTYKVYVWGRSGNGGTGSGVGGGNVTYASGGGGGGGAGGFAASLLTLQAGQEIPITIDASQTKFGSYLSATAGGDGGSVYLAWQGASGGRGGNGAGGNIVNVNGAAGGGGGNGSQTTNSANTSGAAGGNGGAQPGAINGTGGYHRAGSGGGGARLPGAEYCKYVSPHMNDFRGGNGGYNSSNPTATLSGGDGSSIPPISLSPNVKLYGAGCGGGGSSFGSGWTTNRGGYGGTGQGGAIIIEMADNQPPTTPGTVTYTGNMRAGTQVILNCGPSSDPDGDIIRYVWESRVDSNAFVAFDTTDTPTAITTVPMTGGTFQVRVKAVDTKNEGSGYSTGAAQTIIQNSAPTVPGEITYVGQIAANKLIQLTCGPSTDPDGDPFSYVWERSIDGASFTELTTTLDPRANDTVPAVGETYQVRVKAVDSEGAASAYQTGALQHIFHNSPPVISGQDTHLGTLSDPVRYEYTVSDVDAGQTLAVTEKIISDDRVIFQRTFNPQSGAAQAIDTTELWIELNDVELVIEASDGEGGYAIRSVRFKRNVDDISAYRAFATNAPVHKCLIMLVATRPAGSMLTLQVCNNPYDAAPVWEDISQSADQVHTFRNQNVESPGLAYRFSMTRGSGTTQVERVTIKYA